MLDVDIILSDLIVYRIQIYIFVFIDIRFFDFTVVIITWIKYFNQNLYINGAAEGIGVVSLGISK